MKPSPTDDLCTRCGLCCDGSLFADVELARRDNSAALESLGLEIEEDGERANAELLVQPCAALQNRRCTLYAHRPGCCRTFECRLLQAVRRGTLSSAAAHATIAEAFTRIDAVRTRVRQLGPVEEQLSLRDQCTDAVARADEDSRPQIKTSADQLESALADLEHWLHSEFLRPIKSSAPAARRKRTPSEA